MAEEKRTEKRIPCTNIVANILLNGSMQDAGITDVSRRGARIERKITPATSANIILFRKTPKSFYHIKERGCQIIEHANQPHTGIRFANSLTQDEIDILGVEN